MVRHHPSDSLPCSLPASSASGVGLPVPTAMRLSLSLADSSPFHDPQRADRPRGHPRPHSIRPASDFPALPDAPAGSGDIMAGSSAPPGRSARSPGLVPVPRILTFPGGPTMNRCLIYFGGVMVTILRPRSRERDESSRSSREGVGMGWRHVTRLLTQGPKASSGLGPRYQARSHEVPHKVRRQVRNLYGEAEHGRTRFSFDITTLPYRSSRVCIRHHHPYSS